MWQSQVIVPKHLAPIVGRRYFIQTTKTRNTGPASRAKAAETPAHIEFVADALLRIKAARAQQQVERPMAGRFVTLSRRVSTLVEPGMAVNAGRLVIGRDGRHYLIENLPVAEQPSRLDAAALIEDWATDKKADKQAKGAKRRASEKFFTWLNAGHTDYGRVTQPDMLGFRRYLIDEHLAGRIRKSKTAEDYLYTVKALLTYAFEEKKLTTNPGAEVNYKGKTEKKDKWQDFTEEEIALILREVRHVGSDPAWRGAEHFIRWFHCLAAYSGARCAEIAEAQTQDVECIGGIWVLHIRLLYRPPGQRLKNEVSERMVPLHPAILNDGFVSYVEYVRREYHGGGHGPLFPQLTLYGERLNTDASNKSMRWLRRIGISHPKKVNHSWRHTVKTRFRMVDQEGRRIIDEEYSDYLTGHADGREGREYGKYPILVLHAQITNVPAWEIATAAEVAA
jgi:site-specific recombinase XerD